LRTVQVSSDFSIWIRQALALVVQAVSPDDIIWGDPRAHPALPGLGGADDGLAAGRVSYSAPPAFLEAARHAFVHQDSGKWPLLYRILWRLYHDNRHLMRIESDPDIHVLRRLERQVRKDTYRMTQFVRFRKVCTENGDHFVAWHRPDHNVLRLAAPFFVRRFAALRWSILTPFRSAHWDRSRLRFTDGVPEHLAPGPDHLEELWRTYYAAICNPARLNPKAMSAQMPARFWARLPEAVEIAPALSQASSHVSGMVQGQQQRPNTAEFVPDTLDRAVLENASRSCRGCELCFSSTQTVFGQGPAAARMMLIGEQPGDEEDRRGIPFVGPAGQLLDQALREAGLDRQFLYVTNAVKHFRFVPAGRARRHQTPRPAHVTACRPWLDAELRAVKPSVIVCMGATAARSLLGHAFRVTENRGKIISTNWAPKLLVTFHPAAILRAADAQARAGLYRSLVADLTLAAEASAQSSGATL
jgi:DNA polymerase